MKLVLGSTDWKPEAPIERGELRFRIFSKGAGTAAFKAESEVNVPFKEVHSLIMEGAYTDLSRKRFHTEKELQKYGLSTV